MEQTDEQLVRGYREGDEESLYLLIQRHTKVVFNVAYRYSQSIGDAEDITQDTFIKAWKNLKQYDEARPFRTWLLGIARNASRDWLRKKKPAVFSSFESDDAKFADTLQDSELLPDALAEMNIEHARLKRIVEELNPEQQAILFFHNDEELTFQEISDLTGESLNTVKSRYRRTLQQLKKELGE